MDGIIYNRYLDILTSECVFPGTPNPTPSQKDTAVDLRWTVRDHLADMTSTTAIIDQLLSLKRAWTRERVEGQVCSVELLEPLVSMNDAIRDELDRDRQYQQDMRRLLMMAVPELLDAYECVDDAATLQPDDLVVLALQSARRLAIETDHVIVEDLGDARGVIRRLRRHWRWLGNGTAAPYEPLYELVTGRPLINE
ncbi:MAG: hypothetical protein LQ346_007376 [Caloplaca aetnensis]|nr:MAG: hypothetical protein LQ346_007376 [Caloplaca aetnensis]